MNDTLNYPSIEGAQRGSITILAMAMLGLLLGIAALAINVSYVYLVKSELQVAADSAALYAAQNMYTVGVVPPSLASVTSRAQTAATAHSAAGSPITAGEVHPSIVYWNFATRSTSLDSSLTPAVDIRVGKSSIFLFAGSYIFGSASIPLEARATAVTPIPNNVKSGELVLPLGVSNCVMGPGTPTSFYLSVSISIGGYSCQAVNWGNTGLGLLTTSEMSSVISGATKLPATSIGAPINLHTGFIASLKGNLIDCLNTLPSSCRKVVVPIFNTYVPPTGGGFIATSTIIGFACFTLAPVGAGGTADVIFTKSSGCKVIGTPPNYSSTAPPYGVYTAPRLVY